jgi:GDSL-like Lipase/Acylhydrolase family
VRAPRTRVLATLAAGMLVAVGCTGGGRSAAPEPRPEGKPLQYVALGGDDAAGSSRRFVDAWPQQLFRTGLPLSATMVNLAGPRDGVTEIEHDQLQTALRLRPDIATITLVDDLERGTALETVEKTLGEILSRLRRERGLRVLVGTAPPGTAAPEMVDAFNSVVKDTVRKHGGELVDLRGVRAADPDLEALQIANAFAAVIGRT